jgi:hypothetical protein
LQREIKRGEKVVIKAETLRPEYSTLEWRTVEVIIESSGNTPFTNGTALYVRFKDGDECRIDAVADIDVAATRALTKPPAKQRQQSKQHGTQ